MGKLELYKEKINNLLALDDVCDNEDVLSAYSLYTMMLERLNPLYQTCHNKELEKKVLDIYRKKNIINYLFGRNMNCSIRPMIKENKKRKGIFQVRISFLFYQNINVNSVVIYSIDITIIAYLPYVVFSFVICFLGIMSKPDWFISRKPYIF